MSVIVANLQAVTFSGACSQLRWLSALCSRMYIRAESENSENRKEDWYTWETTVSLFWFLAFTTAAALLTFIPSEGVAAFGAVATVLSATMSFLRPAEKRNIHDKASKDFRSLMLQMVSCETEEEYDKLWSEFNREIIEEPLTAKRFAANSDLKFVMSLELRQV